MLFLGRFCEALDSLGAHIGRWIQTGRLPDGTDRLPEAAAYGFQLQSAGVLLTQGAHSSAGKVAG